MRWELLNAGLLCANHHLILPTSWHKAPDLAMEWFERYYGEGRMFWLYSVAAERKGQRTDRRALLLALQAKLKEMP
jgi:hypothetical protein